MLSKDELIEVLGEWNIWAQDVAGFAGIEREVTSEIMKYMDAREAVVLFGVRRAGKSTIMYQLMQKLVGEKKASEKQMLYVNFEEKAFFNELSLGLVDRVFDAYLEKVNPREKTFLFLDEVQKVKGWEQWVRSAYDKRKDVKIVVSGSASKLLGKEFGALLTGRHFSFRIMPLSFKEFASFSGLRFAGREKALAEKHKWKALFSEYLKWGGFPAIALMRKELRKRLLNDYFDDIISRDVQERHEIRDALTLKRIGVFLLTNVANTVSYNSMKNVFGVSVDTAKEYAGYLNEAFLVFENAFFSFSLKEQAARQRKAYCIDIGLRNANTAAFSKDTGRLAENAVFLQLLRDGNEVFYWKDGGEVDFVAKSGKGLAAINVTYGETVDEREFDGLRAFMKKFRVRKALLLTQDELGEKKVAEGKIALEPAWLWLLTQ